jgi:hypothetical protein
MAPLAPLREACLLFRPRRKTLPFLRGMARAACCLAGVTGSLDALAQETPLRPALADAGLAGEFSQDLPATTQDLPAAPESGAANYGKPKPPTQGGKKPKKPQNLALPPLAPYPTSAQARRAGRPGAPADSRAPSPTIAMPAPLPQRPKPRREDDPFAPVGVDAGLLRLKLYEETDLGANSNPNVAPQGSPQLRGSGFLRQEIGANGQSDWSSHAFAGDLRLGYNDFFTAHSADAPDGAGKFTTRIDVARDTKINLDGNFDLTTQLPTSPNLYNGGAPIVLNSRPIIADYGGGIGATQDFNRLALTLRGGAERTWWQNAHFSDGSTQELSRDSYDDYALSARAAYEWTPGIKPFVQGVFDRRLHDSLYDLSGYERDSVGAAFSAGSTFELTRLLTGALAAGYADRHYQDPRLANLRGPVFDASLVWTATALTKVTLRGATTLDETTVPGVSGAITRQGGIEVSHALLRNLTLTATGSWQNATYPGANPGIDQTLFQAGLRAEYSLTRSIVLKGAFTSQRMISSTPGTDYTANIFLVGLRLQQ